MLNLKRLSPYLAAALLLAGVSTSQPTRADAQSEDSWLFFLGRPLPAGQDPRAYYKNLEASTFTNYPTGRARRQGPRLTLQLSDADNITLTDNLTCPPEGRTEENCSEYYFLADLPTRNAILVGRNLGGPIDFQLIDNRSGRRQSLPGIPRFSQTSGMFIVLNCQGAKPARGNALEIYRRADFEYATVFTLSAAELATHVPMPSCQLNSWNNSTLALSFWTAGGDERTAPRVRAELREDTAGWSLDAPWAQAKP